MGLKDVFPGGKSNEDPPEEVTPEQQEVLEKVAKKVVDWRMAVPAIMTLETAKPLSFIGSQVMVFFEPIVQTLFSMKHYDTFRELMEDRDNVERLLQLIEQYDADLKIREKQYKKNLKAYLKRQSVVKRFWLWVTGRYPNSKQLDEEMARLGIPPVQSQNGK